MKKVYIIFSILIVCLSCSKNSNNNTVFIDFGNQKYDSIQLRISLGNDNINTINGHNIAGNNWSFSYSDSLKDRASGMYLRIPSNVDSVERRLTISIVIDKDTLGAGNYIFGNNKIKLNFIKSDTLMDYRYRNSVTGKVELKTSIKDSYVTTSNGDTELTSSIIGLSKSYGYKKHKDSPEIYSNLTNEYPDSRYLISRLYHSITKFESNDDIEMIYNLFSEKNQESYYGQKIRNYLSSPVFDDTALRTWDTGESEYIIQDSSRYNLIIFSASWCAPCHALIPIIKEIDNDLKNKLLITYISTDNTETADNWRKMMQIKEIPWRSLMAENKLKEINEKYIIQGIPHAILVYPHSMKMEIIDLRKQSDRNKLYELF